MPPAGARPRSGTPGCEQFGLDPFAARRNHADVYARTIAGANSTRAQALAALSSLTGT